MSDKVKLIGVVGAMHALFLAQLAKATDDAGKLELVDSLMAGLKETEAQYNLQKIALKEGDNKLTQLQEALDAANAEYKGLKESSIKEITQLSTQLAKAKAVADQADPGFELDGVEYRVIGKVFTYKHKKITVEELLADEDLQEQLVDKKVGFIVRRDKETQA
jgi:predicted nuclease with TOPRIM domain